MRSIDIVDVRGEAVEPGVPVLLHAAFVPEALEGGLDLGALPFFLARPARREIDAGGAAHGPLLDSILGRMLRHPFAAGEGLPA